MPADNPPDAGGAAPESTCTHPPPPRADGPPSYGSRARDLLRRPEAGWPDPSSPAGEQLNLGIQDLWSAAGLDRRYAVEKVVGFGGQGVVCRGRHLRLGKVVAIKLVWNVPAPAGSPADPVDEPRIIARLESKYTVEVLDAGAAAEFAWFAMEWLEGPTLHEKIRCAGPDRRLAWPEAFAVCDHLLEALEEIHALGLYHGDVKPANLQFNRAGEPKLLDFGMARYVDPRTWTTGDQALGGTVRHMAPEVLAGKAADARSDLYGVGTTLYEMLTGLEPYHHCPLTAEWMHGNDALNQAVRGGRLVKELATRLPALDLPDEVLQILAKATEVDAQRRYPTAREFRHALAVALPKPARPPKKAPWGRMLLGLAAALLVAAGLFGWWWTHPGQAHFQGDFNLSVNGSDLLGGPDVVSLKTGDRVTFDAGLTDGARAYFYLIHIDSRGQVTRAHPKGWAWDAPPTGDPAMNLKKSFTIQKSSSGLEAFVWLVRAQPLTAEDGANLGTLFSAPALQWRQTGSVKNKRLVWWKNGHYDSHRGAPEEAENSDPDDPVSQLDKALTAVHAQHLADFSQAVCYPFEGD